MKEESLLLFSLTNETKTHISGLNCLLVQSLHAVNLCTSFSIHVGPAFKKVEAGSLRVLPSTSVFQTRITEIDQKKEELKIEVSSSVAETI